jgi:glycosyltransferase involved in cell wall biosynthesis
LTLLPDHVSSSNQRPRQSNSNTNRDGTVEFVGEITDAEKSEFLGNAAGLVFPIAWREPFGLAMVEAMACGTPVVAMREWLGAGGRRRRVTG